MHSAARTLVFLATALLAFHTAPALAQTCEPTPSTNATRILGTDADGHLTATERPFVSGDRSFYQQLDNGWVFALVRADAGWSLRLYEHANVSDAVDLTSMTPPFSSVPNPRDIFGWHFRNADNTAPNQGDVNAPQHLRTFIVSPALAGTGGFKPPRDPNHLAHPEPGPDAGLGWLRVVDFGLANPEPGQRARMNYLEFDACITWPREPEEQARLQDLASPAYTDEDHEMFGVCGLDLNAHDLEARYLPRTLGGDLDGDGALDHVAQIQRISDGKRGLALCRAGTWLHQIGDEASAIPGLDPGYLDQVEQWQWLAPGDDPPRHLAGHNLPQADGDLLILERVEKQAVAVFWRNGRLRAQQIYRFVEP